MAVIDPDSFSSPNQYDMKHIVLELNRPDVWNEFHTVDNEMVVTKCGRRMFPSCTVKMSGLDENAKYYVGMTLIPVDDFRYEYRDAIWAKNGPASSYTMSQMCLHPDSPGTGEQWMSRIVSFHEAKLISTHSDHNSHLTVDLLRKYQPHIIIVKMLGPDYDLNSSQFRTFSFSETQFISVSAYCNPKVTQLKIDHNPFARGFREKKADERERERLLQLHSNTKNLKGNSSVISESEELAGSMTNKPRGTQAEADAESVTIGGMSPQEIPKDLSVVIEQDSPKRRKGFLRTTASRVRKGLVAIRLFFKKMTTKVATAFNK